jgi:hypothetical protein
MCGIWSILSKNKTGMFPSEQKLIKPLMLLTSLRGEHSTGIFNVTNRFKENRLYYTQMKEVGNPFRLIYEKGFQDIVDPDVDNDLLALVGHGRHATKGTINKENAHPFQSKHIVLIHNGTITSGLTVPEKGTDSEEICKYLATHDNLQDFIDNVRGAYALIWFNTNDLTINYLRNYQRPLHYMETANAIIHASDKETLSYLTQKHNLFTTEAIKEVPVYTHMCWSVDTKEWIEKPTLHSPPYNYVSYSGNMIGWPDYDDDTIYTPSKLTSEKPPLLPAPLNKDLIGKRVKFRLDSYTMVKNHVTFIGTTMYDATYPTSRPIIFKTTKGYKDHWWNMNPRSFLGIISGIEVHGGITYYVIKTKSIKQYIVGNTGVTINDPIETSANTNIVTREGDIISQEDALDMAEQGCYACDDLIMPDDIPSATLYKDSIGNYSLMCDRCSTFVEHNKREHVNLTSIKTH